MTVLTMMITFTGFADQHKRYILLYFRYISCSDTEAAYEDADNWRYLEYISTSNPCEFPGDLPCVVSVYSDYLTVGATREIQFANYLQGLYSAREYALDGVNVEFWKLCD